MDFDDKDTVALIHKRLDSKTFMDYGIGLAHIEAIRKYIEHLETTNKKLTDENKKLTSQLELFAAEDYNKYKI